jgi:uncharacterized protein YggE
MGCDPFGHSHSNSVCIDEIEKNIKLNNMKNSIAFLFVLFSSIGLAQHNPDPSVDVIGEGVVYTIPDQVTIKVQVENEGQDPKELKKTNDRMVNEVLSFIRSQDIDDKDVLTQYIRLSKNYDYQTKKYKYVANQSISIQLNDLDKYESLMSGLMGSGINRIDGIQFSSSNMEVLKSKARVKAIQNARLKAEEYANVLGQSIGKAIRISEIPETNFPVPRNEGLMKAMSDGADQQTLSPGEMELRVTVNVKFILN